MTAAKNGGKRVGYKRVSSIDQNTIRQLDGVQVDKTFTDKASGKDTNRPQLQAALEYVREGDVLVIHSMDRASRNLNDLLHLVEGLTARGITIEFIKEGLVFTGDDSAMSKMLLGIMGSVAQFERSMILERQREGIAKAKEAGVYLGRKPKFDAVAVAVIKGRVEAGEQIAAVAREYGVTRPTIYRVIAQ